MGAECLPALLTAAAGKGEDYLNEVWKFMWPALFKAIELESEPEVKAVFMESMARCIELRGIGCFTIEGYEKLSKVLNCMLGEHLSYEDSKFEQRNDEDYDEDEEDEDEE